MLQCSIRWIGLPTQLQARKMFFGDRSAGTADYRTGPKISAVYPVCQVRNPVSFRRASGLGQDRACHPPVRAAKTPRMDISARAETGPSVRCVASAQN